MSVCQVSMAAPQTASSKNEHDGCSCGNNGTATPQPFAQGKTATRHLRGHVTPDVAVVPRLVAVAGDGLFALRVAHHETETGAVLGEPRAFGGLAPVRKLPGGRTVRAPEVERGPELVLGVAGAGARFEGGFYPVLFDPVREGRFLIGVRAVGGLDL